MMLRMTMHLPKVSFLSLQVTVNGVEILQANLLTVEGVVHVIAGLLYPTLNFCNRETVKTDFVSFSTQYTIILPYPKCV